MPGTMPTLERVDAYAMHGTVAFCKALRALLKRRTGRDWSVTKGRGTASGWVTVTAPPKRCTFGWDGTGEGHNIGADDRAVLAAALQLQRIHPQGESIPASLAHRQEYLDRAAGLPFKVAEQYWD